MVVFDQWTMVTPKFSKLSVTSDIQIPTFFGQFWLQILAFFGQFWLQIRTSSGQFWHPHIRLFSLKLHRPLWGTKTSWNVPLCCSCGAKQCKTLVSLPGIHMIPSLKRSKWNIEYMTLFFFGRCFTSWWFQPPWKILVNMEIFLK